MNNYKFYRNNWIEISARTGFSIRYSKAGYFGERPQLDFYASQLISVLIAAITLPVFGPSWLHLLLLIPFFFGYGHVFLKLPFRSGIQDHEAPQFGIYFYGEGKLWYFDSIWLCVGSKRKCYYMPWSWEWVRTSVLRNDGNWEHERKGERKDFYDLKKWEGVLFRETHPYTYTLNDGTMQHANATIRVDEREWRWKGLMFLPFPRKVRRTIDVSFNREMGERAGSWKGGTVGCSYEMKAGETPLLTLRRMERERRFR